MNCIFAKTTKLSAFAEKLDDGRTIGPLASVAFYHQRAETGSASWLQVSRGRVIFFFFLQFLGYSSCLPLLLWLRSSRKTQWLRLIVQRPLCNICSFPKKKSYVPIKEQHCKHTEEMLFLADTYNTYLGNFQMHTQTKYKKYKKREFTK